MNKILIFILGLCLFSSCQSKSSDKNKDLENTVDSLKTTALEIHDLIMPDMGKLEDYTRYISNQLDSNQKDSAQLKAILYDLKAADKSMWDWMYAYKKDTAASLEIQKNYYEHQLESIKIVQEKMNSSMEKAKKYKHNEE